MLNKGEVILKKWATKKPNDHGLDILLIRVGVRDSLRWVEKPRVTRDYYSLGCITCLEKNVKHIATLT